MNRVWILSLCLMGTSPVVAQESSLASMSAPLRVDQNWNRLRTLLSSLVTDEGTRKVFSAHRSLCDAFTSEDHFSYFVAPWRPRLSVLPEVRQDAKNVDVEVLPKADGTTICLLTYHHLQPANSITIVKTVWMDESLLKVTFMKGFAHIPDENASRNRMNAREESYRQWAMPTPPIKK